MLQKAEIGFALRDVCTKPPCSSILCFVQREIVEIEQELLYVLGLPVGNIKEREINDIFLGETLVLGMIESPHADKLFDRHWISFDSDGQLIWQHEAAGDALRCWGIEGANVIQPFAREQEQYLQLHRECLR